MEGLRESARGERGKGGRKGEKKGTQEIDKDCEIDRDT